MSSAPRPTTSGSGSQPGLGLVGAQRPERLDPAGQQRAPRRQRRSDTGTQDGGCQPGEDPLASGSAPAPPRSAGRSRRPRGGGPGPGRARAGRPGRPARRTPPDRRRGSRSPRVTSGSVCDVGYVDSRVPNSSPAGPTGPLARRRASRRSNAGTPAGPSASRTSTFSPIWLSGWAAASAGVPRTGPTPPPTHVRATRAMPTTVRSTCGPSGSPNPVSNWVTSSGVSSLSGSGSPTRSRQVVREGPRAPAPRRPRRRAVPGRRSPPG